MVLLSITILIKNRKIKNLETVIHAVSDANNGIREEQDSVINTIDSIVTVIYYDSIVYEDGAKKLIQENNLLKEKILNNSKNDKYKDLNIWLNDSLEYYDVFDKGAK